MKLIAGLLVMLQVTVALAGIDEKHRKKLIIPERGGIEEQWIIVFKEKSVKDTRSVVNRLTKEYSCSTRHIYDKVFKGFSANMPAQVAAAMADDSDVAYIEQDQALQPVYSWGLDRIDQEDLPLDGSYTPNFGNDGAGVTVYIFDYGLRHTHVDFGGRASAPKALDFMGGDGSDKGWGGHGTAVAGVIGGSKTGVAKAVTLVSIRVCSGEMKGCPVSDVEEGLEHVIEQKGPRIANISLGGAISPSLDEAVAEAIDADVTVVVAAGNYDKDACTISPCHVKKTICVGATDENDTRWKKDNNEASNYGKCVDIFAPGNYVQTTSYLSDSSYGKFSATSCATAFVSGAAALVLGDHPNVKSTTVFKKLMNDALLDKVSDAKTKQNRLLYVGPIKCEKIGSPCTNLHCCWTLFARCIDGVCKYVIPPALLSLFSLIWTEYEWPWHKFGWPLGILVLVAFIWVAREWLKGGKQGAMKVGTQKRMKTKERVD